MKLPNAGSAVIGAPKIRDYLLASDHPDSRGKSAFFLALGYRPEKWQLLAEGIQAMIAAAAVTQELESRHGTKYTVDGDLVAPTGRSVKLRTVWIVDRGESAPRLVTAYPLEKE